MADFRTVQTRMWREDEWFQSLSCEARLLWMYLFTNPSANAAGLYRLPLRTIAFESGLDHKRVEELLTDFGKAGKAHYENGVVFVVNMQRLQHPEISWQVATRIAADVDAVPDGRLKDLYLKRYGYPIVKETPDDKGRITRSVEYQYPTDTPSIPYRYTDTDTVTDTHTKGNGASAGASAPVPNPLDDCLKYLHEPNANGPRAIGRLMELRFGDTYKPDYARIGKMGKDIGGDYIALANLVWSAAKPEGDPHNYVAGMIRKSKAKPAETGSTDPTEDW